MSHTPPSGPAPQGPQYTQQPGQYPPPGYGQQPEYGQQPPQKKRKKRWVVPTAVGVGAFVLGTLVGVSGQPEPEVVTQTKEVEVATEVTPAVCLEALDNAEQGFDMASQVIGHLQDALTAAGNEDVAGINAAAEELKMLNPELTALVDPMNETKAECRAGS